MRKLYQTLENKRAFANVRGRNQFGEYEVVLYPSNIREKPFVTYHTNDLSDACMTANSIIFGINPRMAEIANAIRKVV